MVIPSELLNLIVALAITSTYYHIKHYYLVKRIYALHDWLEAEIESSILQEQHNKYNLQYICNNPWVIKTIKRKLFFKNQLWK